MTCFRVLRLTFLLLSLVLSGCDMGAAAPPPAATTSTASAAATSTLAPGEGGTVSGILLRTGTREPFPEGLDLFLAEVLPSVDGSVSMAGLNKSAAPRVAPDATGRFTFEGVKPGQYALAGASPINETLVPDPEKPEDVVLVTVEAGQTVDLGTLFLDLKF